MTTRRLTSAAPAVPCPGPPAAPDWPHAAPAPYPGARHDSRSPRSWPSPFELRTHPSAKQKYLNSKYYVFIKITFL